MIERGELREWTWIVVEEKETRLGRGSYCVLQRRTGGEGQKIEACSCYLLIQVLIRSYNINCLPDKCGNTGGKLPGREKLQTKIFKGDIGDLDRGDK